VLNVVSDVVGILVTSTNFITGTGLKKCKPQNLSFLIIDLAISWSGSEDVLLANIVLLY
jgi:hypothetical protein